MGLVYWAIAYRGFFQAGIDWRLRFRHLFARRFSVFLYHYYLKKIKCALIKTISVCCEFKPKACLSEQTS